MHDLNTKEQLITRPPSDPDRSTDKVNLAKATFPASTEMSAITQYVALGHPIVNKWLLGR